MGSYNSYPVEHSMIPPCPPPMALPLHCMVGCRDAQQGPHADQHRHLLPLRAPSASNLQVGLRKPPPQSLRHWSSEQRAWPGLHGAGLRHCHCCHHKMAQASLGHCCKRPRQRACTGVGSRRHSCNHCKGAHLRANAVPKAGQNRHCKRHCKRACWLCRRVHQLS